MNATYGRLDALLDELAALGVKLEPTGDENLTIDAPKGALTSDLIARLKTSKVDLLWRLRTSGTIGRHQCATASEYPVEAPVAGPETDDDCPEDGVEVIDPVEWNGCPTCGRLDAWQSEAGDRFGRTPGRWRCLRCDPPAASRRMLAVAARIRADEVRRHPTYAITQPGFKSGDRTAAQFRVCLPGCTDETEAKVYILISFDDPGGDCDYPELDPPPGVTPPPEPIRSIVESRTIVMKPTSAFCNTCDC